MEATRPETQVGVGVSFSVAKLMYILYNIRLCFGWNQF